MLEHVSDMRLNILSDPLPLLAVIIPRIDLILTLQIFLSNIFW